MAGVRLGAPPPPGLRVAVVPPPPPPDPVRSYSLSLPSSVPLSTNRPLGLNRTPPTGGLPSAYTVLRHSPVAVSQILTRPS